MSEKLSIPRPRVAVFIDGLNTMFRLRELGWEECFDIGYLAQRLARKRELVGVFFYRAAPSSPPLSQKQYWIERHHLDHIESQLWKDFGRKVRYGYMVSRGRKWLEKQTDIWLASEMISLAHGNAYDIAILVTADSDQVPAAEHVRMVGKGVELLVFPNSQPAITQLVRAVNSTTTARHSFFKCYPSN